MNYFSLYKTSTRNPHFTVSYGKIKSIGANQGPASRNRKRNSLGPKKYSSLQCRAIPLKADRRSAVKVRLQPEDELYKNHNISDNLGSSVAYYGSTAYTFTTHLPFGFRINITPSIQASHSESVNRTVASLMDIDGDGLPDLVYSNSDSRLVVHRNLTGRTNLLRTVTLPFGGHIHIGYQQTEPSFDMPGRRWVQTPKHNDEQGSTPGTPINWNDPSNPDDPQAGYGYIPNDTTTEETFFFHSDHLGSTSYITDDKGNITQYDAYLPYGELLVDEHSSSGEMPYKFNGKEFDDETGLYYYGARYMNPVTSMWYGVDPLAEKYATTSGYVYTLNNPIKLGDSDGRKVKLTNNEEDLAAIRETLPHRLREYITANDGFIDKQKMEEGLNAMGDDVSLNYRSLFEIVADDRTVKFSLLDKPHAVNASGNTPKHMITFGPTLYFEADNIGNPAEWITQGGTSISLAPKSHKWTKWDNIQRARLAEDEVQFSPNENYQVQINSSMYKNDATHKNGAKAVAHELYGHILYMFRGWDSAHGSNRKVDNQKLENWLQRIGNETEYNFDH